jgi:hypothetical protein
MTPIAEKRIPLTLDKERVLIFNCNTMVAYEEATGKFFLDTIASLYDALKPLLDARLAVKAGKTDQPMVTGMEVVRRVPMTQLRALVWAACHEYKNDEPVWPLTITQVGRYIRLDNLVQVFQLFLLGHSKNSPTEKELGESQPSSASLAEPAAAPQTNGGERSIELPEDAFDSVNGKLDG